MHADALPPSTQATRQPSLSAYLQPIRMAFDAKGDVLKSVNGSTANLASEKAILRDLLALVGCASVHTYNPNTGAWKRFQADDLRRALYGK